MYLLFLRGAYPISWFLLATLLFYLAIQQPCGYRRNLLATLHVIAVGLSLITNNLVLALFPPLVVPFAIGLTVHTTSILLDANQVFQLSSVPLFQRLRLFACVWSNILRRSTLPAQSNCTKNNGIYELSFAIRRSAHALILWVVNYGITKFLNHATLSLRITIHDFAPDKQKFLPPLTYHDLAIRGIFSIYWIWSTYMGLTSAHDVCAVVFVSVLRWNQPSEWPPLFGNLHEAYSLRRFWGIFWHRLHLAPFAAYTPSFLKHRGGPYAAARKALRSMWIFFLSACCHVLVNWVLFRRSMAQQQIVFFALNWVVCLAETIMTSLAKRGTCLDICTKCAVIKQASRILGYAWVWIFFICTVPAWQYPLVYRE